MILIEFLKLIKAKLNSRYSNEDFIRMFDKKLSKIEIATSFSPEQLRFLDKDLNPLKALDVVQSELNIKDIRLGVRWSHDFHENKTSLEEFPEFFEYALKQDTNITLNLGPIKTFRWPEEHIPKKILKELDPVPLKNSKVSRDHKLYNLAVAHLRELIHTIKVSYKDELQKISTIQVDNEPFYSFGEFGWILDRNYVLETILLLHSEFPEKEILISSAGRNNFYEITTIFENLVSQSSSFINKLKIGYNYYYRVPGEEFRDNLITLFKNFMTTSKLRKLALELGFKIEVSEMQMEPWIGFSQKPGNSVQDFRFALIRCLNEILDLNTDNKSVVRVWGIEELVRKIMRNELTAEHEKIFELIKYINSKNKKVPEIS